MSNYLDEGAFNDMPEEAEGSYDSRGNWIANNAPQAEVRVARLTGPATPPQQTQAEPEQEEAEEETEEVEDLSDLFTDANLRIEQGRLYQMILNESLFQDSDMHPKAVQNVEKEIRKFARERMEIMLGMRQETPKEAVLTMDGFPFNNLEVEVLKSLASAASKGATEDSEPFTPSPTKKKSLTPIGAKTQNKAKPAPKAPAKASKPLNSKPAQPLARPKPSAAIQRILDEEGLTMDQVNEVFDPKYRPLDGSPDVLSPEELAERNRQANSRLGKTVKSTQAVPMPSAEQMEAQYAAQAAKAAANPHMQTIMSLLNNRK